VRASPQRLLGVAIGLLVLVLALEWLWPASEGAAAILPPSRVAAQHAVAAPVIARETSGWGSTILARPLFSISRRPPRVASGGSGPAIAGQARLSGILIGRGGRRAIFAPEGGGKPLVLGEGASINDSIIRRIQADRVLLASGAVLLPAYDKSGRSATTIPPFVPAFQPAFTNPGFPQGFPNPAMPNPAFNQGFPAPGFTPGGIQPQLPNNDEAPGNGLPPNFRNPTLPQRREP
jgi:hypothetical protein